MRCKNANGFEPASARLLSGMMTVVLDDRYHTGGARLHRDMWEWKQAGNRIRANAPHSSRKKKKHARTCTNTHTNTTNSPLQWLMSVWTLSNAPLYRWLIVTGREALGVNLWFVKMQNCESVASCGNVSQRERERKKIRDTLQSFPYNTRKYLDYAYSCCIWTIHSDLMCK